MPVSTGEPPQSAVNLTGMVLLSLNVRNGLAKLPPVESAPPMGARNPLKPNGARLTVKVQLEWLPLASVAVQVTFVFPLAKTEPEAGEQITVSALPQASVAEGTANFTTAEHRPGSVPVTILIGQRMPLLGRVPDGSNFTVA